MRQEKNSNKRAALYVLLYTTLAGLSALARWPLRHPHRSYPSTPPFIIGSLCSVTLFAAGMLVVAEPAEAACNSVAPATGQTVTCDSFAPNPFTLGVAAAGSTNVTININPGSQLSIARTTTPVATSVNANSEINNSGTISLTGGGGSGGNRGAGMLGTGNNNVLTNTARARSATAALSTTAWRPTAAAIS